MTEALPLFVPSAPAVEGDAFQTDKLARAPLAQVLTGYVKRLRNGATLAVNAEWGQGKTWFARNWKQQLDQSNHPVIYIDAFQADYMEDPFTLISGEILGVIRSQTKKAKFIKAATNVALAIAPTALKAAVKGGGKLVLGVSDLDEGLVEAGKKLAESAEDSLGKLLENKIKSYHEGQKSIATFRKNLTEFAAGCTQPLVIIIDELDRCKPQFSVSLLERIKHFFDVQNVVFVLFLNKEQMHNAIRGVYGPSTDAHTYLEKFLNFTFSLEHPRTDKMRPFIEFELAKYRLPVSTQNEEFRDGLCALTEAFAVTPRQVERIVALLVLAHPVPTAAILLAELAVLRTSRPELFAGILRGDRASHTDVLNILLAQERKNGESRSSNEEIAFLTTVHRALIEEDGEAHYSHVLLSTYNHKKDNVRKDYLAVSKLLDLVVR